jgi:DNA-binding XRE family transcriptional regulator
MSKRKPMDKEQARERRNALLAAAAAADLSLTEGVREMRAIAGMTQEEFARHREVSARVIKAIELGQGNPTVATLNRIGQFFGLEVGFVPVKRKPAAETVPQTVAVPTDVWSASASYGDVLQQLGTVSMSDVVRQAIEDGIRAGLREAVETIASHKLGNNTRSSESQVSEREAAPARKKRKAPSA